MSAILRTHAINFKCRQYNAPACLTDFFQAFQDLLAIADADTVIKCLEWYGKGNDHLKSWQAAHEYVMKFKLDLISSNADEAEKTLNLKLYFTTALWCLGFNTDGIDSRHFLMTILFVPNSGISVSPIAYQDFLRKETPAGLRPEIRNLLYDFMICSAEISEQRNGHSTINMASLITTVSAINILLGCDRWSKVYPSLWNPLKEALADLECYLQPKKE